jgi:murein DD-endopeptidase MepM/ murein hydrolase activator NlpD
VIVPELKPASRALSLQLSDGGTLIEALRKLGVSMQDSVAASGTLVELFDPRKFKAGQSFRVRLSPSQEDAADLCLEGLEFSPETDRLISLQHRSHTEFAAAESAIEHAPDLALREGSIDTSLFEAAQAAEVPAPIVLETYRVLAHAIDFQRDLRSGDQFAVGYEIFDDGSGRLHEGRLVYAALGAGERNVRVFRYTTSDGFEGFFDQSGASIATSLLRTPVDGARLSSLYGKRDHPILNYTRMHRGLDFAAPRGTPVLAAGDGVVVRRERFGSFGNYVRIKHDTSYATAYAHLSGYARGLQRGERVRQGEVIGYVGATGLATGPNLHFEVLRDDRQVNPMALKLPPRKRRAGEELERFESAKAKLRAAFSASSKVQI